MIKKRYLIKPVLLILTLSTVTTVLFLLNCAQQGGVTGPGGNTPGNQEGFSPNGLNRGGGNGGGEGFSPNQGTQYSSVGHTPRDSDDDDDDPFHKSDSVEDNEKKWGISAPIGKAGDDEIDQDVLEDFLLGNKINTMDDIVDFRVYVKLRKTGSHRFGDNITRNFYGGKITIGYFDWDRNKPFKARLESGQGDNAQYNVWLTGTGGRAGTKTFHGFFQDIDGAVILVIDRETRFVRDAEDDTENTLYGGSIWIMAFKEIFPVRETKGNSCAKRDGLHVRRYNQQNRFDSLIQPNKKCWFIDRGPFDCRAWRHGNGVNTLKTLEPDNACYTKLGDFSGLDILKAFGVRRLSDL